jgi:predicted nucleotidyltransferase
MNAADAVPARLDIFEGTDPDETTFLAVLRRALAALDEAEVPYGLLGGVASAVYGRPRWTHDIDVFVRPHDARTALEALGQRGFATQERDPHWLYKAVRQGVLVDVLFKAKGDIYLDEQMIARLACRAFQGVPVRVIPPEDLLVIKAIVHDEPTPRHWHDCLAILARTPLDWDYLLDRSCHGPHRVLSLLLYAVSNGLVVPQSTIEALFSTLYPSKGG